MTSQRGKTHIPKMEKRTSCDLLSLNCWLDAVVVWKKAQRRNGKTHTVIFSVIQTSKKDANQKVWGAHEINFTFGKIFG